MPYLIPNYSLGDIMVDKSSLEIDREAAIAKLYPDQSTWETNSAVQSMKVADISRDTVLTYGRNHAGGNSEPWGEGEHQMGNAN
ncbi:MAG: hypothetical protein K8I82_04595, partial [Anaerolineae bacterium]|nr:hypothetical protein [Anaerolineae bacterium]